MAPLLVIAALVLGAGPSSSVLPSPTGHVSIAQGVLSGPQSGDLRAAARAFVLQRRDELGLPATSTLGAPQAFSTRFGGSVHLPQLVDGLEVQGGKAIVTFDTQGRIVRVASSLVPYTKSVSQWTFTGPMALLKATKEVEHALFRDDGAPHGGYSPKFFPVGDEVHAGYLVWVPTIRPTENWHLAIDATNGAVLWMEDRTHRGFEANVYASSPGGLGAGVGVTPTTQVTLTHFDGGRLSGEQIRAYNCCPTQNCDPDAGQRRATGQLQTFGGQVVSYDLAICDRYQRATNDPAVNPAGNYLYTPVDPPTGSGPNLASPADWDTFAEVHAYFHVNKVYDYLKDLSAGPIGPDAGFLPFILRDQKIGKVAAVQVNASEPTFPQQPNAQGVYASNVMQRVENAVFMARENMAAVSVPEQAFDTDALVMYQGTNGDYAYDGPVIWHEFGHGAIYSTANWNHFATVDSRSANDESSALHEGSADIVAAMVGNDPKIGAYVGPRADPTTPVIRDVNNTAQCPDVLWGESHQDSLHYTGAIWQARSQNFQGTDQGKTFDAAFYAALVSFPPNVDFEKAAAIISHSVGIAFPNLPLAQSQMQQLFGARGVSGCSKVLDVTNVVQPRILYVIPGTTFAQVGAMQQVPGPYQLKFRVPNGAKSVRANAVTFGGGGGAGATPRFQLVAKSNQPITFTRTGQNLANDAEQMAPAVTANGMATATVPINVPCGGEVYFTLVNTSTRDRTLQNLTFAFTPADSCPVDAGMPEVDAGTMTEVDAGTTPTDPDGGSQPTMPMDTKVESVPDSLGPAAVVPGCGCNAGPLGAAWLLLALAVPLLRRRRS